MDINLFTLPKAELHVHLIGTLEPSLLRKLAQKNSIPLPDELIKNDHYRAFHDLQSFLDIYYQAGRAVKTAHDFYDITYQYLKKVAQQGVLHAEFFFEVQSYFPRGIRFETIMEGITGAMQDAHAHCGITSKPILCFLRHLSQKNALEILQTSLAFKKHIVGIGLASYEANHPPSDFTLLFSEAKKHGYKLCAHAGENAGPDYIWQAIELLQVDRIDHGIRCVEDKKLINYLAKKQTPLTVCPLSNIRLNVFQKNNHPIQALMDCNLNVSIHSDDPAFFGGYINTNYEAAHTIGVSQEQLIQSAYNSIISSFASNNRKQEMITLFHAWQKKNQKHS